MKTDHRGASVHIESCGILVIVGNWKAVDSHKKRRVEADMGRNITQQLKMATPQAFPSMGEHAKRDKNKFKFCHVRM